MPRLSYFLFCDVLHIWTIRAIPTYRVYRLYDIVSSFLSTNVYKGIDEFPSEFTGDMVTHRLSTLLIQVTYLVTVPGKKLNATSSFHILKGNYPIVQLSLGCCPNPKFYGAVEMLHNYHV